MPGNINRVTLATLHLDGGIQPWKLRLKKPMRNLQAFGARGLLQRNTVSKAEANLVTGKGEPFLKRGEKQQIMLRTEPSGECCGVHKAPFTQYQSFRYCDSSADGSGT